MTTRYFREDSVSRDLLILLVIFGFLWLTSCGMWDLRGPDETRYTQIAKELLQRRNWFTLTIHGQAYDQKPPLPFWLFAIALKANSGEISTWLLRLPSVLAGLGTIVLTYLMGRRSFGRQAGFLAAFMLGTMAVFVENTPAVGLNVLYTFSITLAIWSWQQAIKLSSKNRIWIGLFWMGAMLAFFIKGPLAFLIVASALGWAAWYEKSLGCIKAIRPGIGLVVLILIVGGWLYVQKTIYGSSFVSGQVSSQVFDRLTAGDHNEPFWFYIPRLFTNILFPWSLPLLLLPWALRKSPVPFQKSILPTCYSGWIIIPFLLLCLVPGKRQTYVIPLLPAAAIILAAIFEKTLSYRLVTMARKQKLAFMLALPGIILMIAAVYGFSHGRYVRNDMIWIPKQGLILLAGSGFAIIVTSWLYSRAAPRVNNLLYSLGALAIIFNWTNFTIINPALDPVKSTRYFSATLDKMINNSPNLADGSHREIAAIGRAANPEYHVYGHYAVRSYEVSAIKDGDILTTTLPGIILLNPSLKQAPQVSEALKQGGFNYRRLYEVSRDPIEVFSRSNTDNPETSSVINFFALGDTGSGRSQIYNVVQQMITRRAEASPCGVFLLGDNIYNGHSISVSLKELFQRPFQPVIDSGIPIYAILGNHDYDNERMRGEVEYPTFNMAGNRYYKLDYHFGQSSVAVFLCDSESMVSGDPDQVKWIKEQVHVSTAQWKILMLHRPVQASEGLHGPSQKLLGILQPVLGEVNLVISGHNHIYERRVLKGDTLHVTVGSGGQLEQGSFQPDPERAIGYDAMGTFLEVAIKQDSLSIIAWNEQGDSIDNFTMQSPSHDTKPVVVTNQTTSTMAMLPATDELTGKDNQVCGY